MKRDQSEYYRQRAVTEAKSADAADSVEAAAAHATMSRLYRALADEPLPDSARPPERPTLADEQAEQRRNTAQPRAAFRV